MVDKVLGRCARNIEIGGDRVRLRFDPPLTQEERQLLDKRFSKMGYYLIEHPPLEEEEPPDEG